MRRAGARASAFLQRLTIWVGTQPCGQLCSGDGSSSKAQGARTVAERGSLYGGVLQLLCGDRQLPWRKTNGEPENLVPYVHTASLTNGPMSPEAGRCAREVHGAPYTFRNSPQKPKESAE